MGMLAIKLAERIMVLDRALEIAVMLSGERLTKERLLERAAQELKAEGENEKQNNS